jgi:RNA recognition motif-containing protein
MSTRLDVGNLSSAAHPDTLRRWFAEHGEVEDVRIVAGGHAFVTMATRSGAKAAIAAMDGATFDDQAIRVIEAREQPGDANGRRSSSEKPQKLRITRQFRERTNVTYEIDHADTPLCIRMYPTDDGAGDAKWRVEVTSSRAGDAVITASAATRTAALEDAGRAWREHGATLNLPTLDWKAILQFMAAVRAV